MGELNPKNPKTDELWKEYSHKRTTELKNELVLRYLYLVKSIVFRMLPTYENYSSYDDLTSCGVLGLMDAIDKYDLRREVKFEYYASMRIKGEIIDHIRKQDWAPYSLRKKIKAVSNAYSELEAILCREPTDSEVAAHLDMKEDELHKVIRKSYMFNLVHFEEMVSENHTWGDMIQDKGETPEEHVENREVVRILGDFIDALPEKEKLVITLYYYEEMTLKEIANVLGMSESRISQIHSKVILKLKTKMQYAFNR